VEFSEFIASDRFPETGFADRTPGSRDAGKGLLASLLLHIGIAVAAVGAIAVDPSENPPPVIDLTLFPPAGAGSTGGIPPPPSALPQAKPTPAVAHFAAPSSPLAEPEVARPVPPEEKAPPVGASVGSAQPVGPAALRTAAVPGTEESRAVPGARGPVTASGIPPAPGAGIGTPGAGSGGEGLQGTRPDGASRYLERNYLSIREAIQKGISYPAIARKMGWEGKVVVLFRILADGSVRDVRVVQGSGHAVLDRGAIEAVRGASPFPRPPAEAEIITPVVYRLN